MNYRITLMMVTHGKFTSIKTTKREAKTSRTNTASKQKAKSMKKVKKSTMRRMKRQGQLF